MGRNTSMASDIADFAQRGAIVSIRLQNFMTYDDCTLSKPAANLNMILGPNGSGKSAIVCAIIVGLAGEVSLTNRAASPAQLVQRGRDWASTRIELFNDRGKNYVVERKIIITNRAKLDHKSEWRLNGAPKLKSDIVALMTDLNIKVDNLCQFLPQDSVAQFVRMSPSDLLTNTLKAAGDNRLVEQHVKLIEYSEEIRHKNRELNTLKEACKHNEINARRLETEVEKLREREQMKKKKEICDQKIHYARYLEASSRVDESKSELTSMEDQLKVARQNADPFRRDAEACKAEETRLKQVVDNLNLECSRTPGLIDQLKASIEGCKVKCQEKFHNFKTKADEENHREQQIRMKQQELDSWECRLTEVREVDYGKEIVETEKKCEEIKKKLLQANYDKSTVEERLRDTIQKIESAKRDRDKLLAVREEKIRFVGNKRPQCHRVIEWLAKNRDKFVGRIHLPMLCEINVKDQNNSAFIENIVSEADLFAFVCENETDLKAFTKITREELRCKINVILMPEKTLEEFEFDSSTQRRQSGHTNPDAFLKDFIEAPDAILRYLYGQYELHKIPAFKEERGQTQLKVLLENYKKFFVGNRFYTVLRSRYDNERVTSTDTLRDARNLIHTLNVKEIEESERKIKQYQEAKEQQESERIRLNRLYDDTNKNWDELAKLVTEYKRKNEEKRRIEVRINTCRGAISALQTEKIDIDAEREKLRVSVIEINKSMARDLARLAKACEAYSKARKDLYLNALLCSLALRNYNIAHKKHKAAMNDANRLVESLREQKEKISSLEKQAKRLRQFAEEKIPGFQDDRLNNKTKRSFDSIEQSTVDELEQLSTELSIRIRNISQDANSAIMNEFRRETEELREKQLRISELEKEVSLETVAMSEIKESWLPKLQEVLKVIDEHYQDFMQKLNYGGKVELDHDASNPDDFRSYGIMIMVKYRDNEQPIPLSSTRQSGGERSVATMIYMLALQTKTTVPFRVVDEINQGMDKENERKVFELLVRTADESSSQYFLVSPKLLQGLNYGDKMQIHIVFNGRNLNYNWESLFSRDDYTLKGDSDDES